MTACRHGTPLRSRCHLCVQSAQDDHRRADTAIREAMRTLEAFTYLTRAPTWAEVEAGIDVLIEMRITHPVVMADIDLGRERGAA